MNDINLSNKEETVLWNETARRLLMLKSSATIPTEWVDRLHRQLPPKQVNETFAELIRRASVESQAKYSNKTVTSIGEPRDKTFLPLSEFVRLAADSSSEHEVSLPDPNYDLESEDGRFRLKIKMIKQRIQINIQALGFASDEFSGCTVAIANPANKVMPVAIIQLDLEGDGSCVVEDSDDIRVALLKPTLLLVKES
jgi:hypothetical protein